MKLTKKIKIFTFTFLILFLFLGSFSAVLAKEKEGVKPIPLKLQTSIPGFSGNMEFDGTTTVLAKYIKAIYTYAISIVGIVATIMLMFGGFVWLTAGGSGDKVGQARDIIFGSLTGLVLALTSYTLLNMINPDLVNFKVIRLDTPDKRDGITMCLYDQKTEKYFCKDGSKCNLSTLLCTNNTDFTKDATSYMWMNATYCNATFSDNTKAHYVSQPTNEKCLNVEKPGGNVVCCGIYLK